jgi:hypothetical protein
VASGEAEAIGVVYGAITDARPTNELIAIKYLEALGTMADGRATKIFLPTDTAGLLGSLAGVAELFRDGQRSDGTDRTDGTAAATSGSADDVVPGTSGVV